MIDELQGDQLQGVLQQTQESILLKYSPRLLLLQVTLFNI